MEEHEEQGGNRVEVPPGFRFHPTDEELINCYLRRKVMASANHHFELEHVIREIDLNKLEPWDLREKCRVDASSHQTEWYFFSHKDKKYPTGMRTNRATKAGFWKATGRDKAVFTSSHGGGQRRIGMRKTLVFYKGRAPNGLKTDWIMHEYRLLHDHPSQVNSNFIIQPNSNCSNAIKEDGGWVVCRVFKKRNYEERMISHATSTLSDEEEPSIKQLRRKVM